MTRSNPSSEQPHPDNHPAWVIPSALTMLTSTSVRIPSTAHAAILEGHLPDFFQHSDPLYSFSYVLSGSARIECKQGKHVSCFAARPDRFSITPGGGEFAYCHPQSLESLILGIDPAELAEIADREFRPYSGTVELVSVHQKSSLEIVGLARSLATLVCSPRPGSRLYSEALWTQIVVQLLWGYSSLPRHGELAFEPMENPRIRRVINFIEANLSENISLRDLAAITGLSPNHFLNSFKRATGKSPHRYLTERRIHRACDLLRNPMITIISVALAVGFSSHSHFSSAFARYMKISPSSYRRQVLGIDSEPR